MGNKIFIIGITGGFGSGKSAASSFFERRGFTKIILSSFLEEEARKRGFQKITRKILQDIGNEWRKRYGVGILAKKTLEYLGKKGIKKSVVDGIRNKGEVKEFKKIKNFILIAIVSSKKNRFERLKNLKRRERLTFELFKKIDRRDQGLGQKDTGLQVAACIKAADFIVKNNLDYKTFENKLNKFFKKI
ncbi:MAG: hypothetical protein HYT08_02280 [Candidatus Levybacteria bacterium]|nr:hypothetical protein [Candidatus Levybacteria bacterium]